MKTLIKFAVITILLTGCNSTYTPGSEVFPPRSLERIALWQLNGLGVTPAFFQDHWTLIVLADASCPAACAQRLKLIMQIEDVQHLFVAEQNADYKAMQQLYKHYPGLVVTNGVTAASMGFFLGQLLEDDVKEADSAFPIYIVNTQGKVVYRYPGSGEKNGLKNVLKKLR